MNCHATCGRSWAGSILTATLVSAAGAACAGSAAPAIQFTFVPRYGTTADLTGRVSGVTFSQYRVAVYIYVSAWWTKPTFTNPVTTIQGDGSWTCDITTGGSDALATRIAAFLIPQSYSPPQANGLDSLPADLYSNAVAQVTTNRPYAREFAFSGYWWSVKDSGGQAWGPGPNCFSDSTSNVWLDAQGRLHLKIARRGGLWYCSEVVSERSFGLGTYRVFLDSAAQNLDRNIVLGLFTWSDDPAYTHRELDVELSRWGNAGDPSNAQFVVQPSDTPGDLQRFAVPQALTGSTHSFTWQSNAVDFVSHAGAYAIPPASNTAVAAWSFTAAGVPVPGDENFRMNLWLSNGAAPSDSNDAEAVVSRFVFVPLQVPPPVVTSAVARAGSGFALGASTEPQLTCRVEASTNLADWAALTNVVATNATVVYSDPSATNYPRRFYRVAVPPQ